MHSETQISAWIKVMSDAVILERALECYRFRSQEFLSCHRFLSQNRWNFEGDVSWRLFFCSSCPNPIFHLHQFVMEYDWVSRTVCLAWHHCHHRCQIWLQNFCAAKAKGVKIEWTENCPWVPYREDRLEECLIGTDPVWLESAWEFENIWNKKKSIQPPTEPRVTGLSKLIAGTGCALPEWCNKQAKIWIKNWCTSLFRGILSCLCKFWFWLLWWSSSVCSLHLMPWRGLGFGNGIFFGRI